MSLTLETKAAVAQLAERFTFAETALQHDLAQRIEAALEEWKATKLQALVAKALRASLRQHIEAEIEAWFRGFDYAQPLPPLEPPA